MNSSDRERQESLEYLKNASHHAVLNCFCNISFGCYGIGNCNAACFGDIMHTNNEGTCLKSEGAVCTCHRVNITRQLELARKAKKEKYKAAVMKRDKAVQEAKAKGDP